MEISQLVETTLQKLKDVLDKNSVIGQAITNDDVTIIPIMKMSVGFATAGAEIISNDNKNGNKSPLAGIGGGANVVPMGFLVIDGITAKYIKTDGGETLCDCVDGILEFLKK